MRELSLFTGAGGGLLGTMLLGFRPIGYVEWDDYCQRVIAARIRDGILPGAPIFGDIKTFISEGYAASYTGLVDVITGGFPCQPFSVAGKQKGADDERNMWPATVEVVGIVHPRFVLLENVPGVRTYLPVVVRDLRRLGYEVSRPIILGADDVGAPHRRKRVWIVANRKGVRFIGGIEAERRSIPDWFQWREVGPESCGQDSHATDTPDSPDPIRLDGNDAGLCPGKVSQFQEAEVSGLLTDSASIGCKNGGGVQSGLHRPHGRDGEREGFGDCGGWERPWPEVATRLCRVDDGVAHRLDRLKALGNGQVPQVAATAWRVLTGFANDGEFVTLNLSNLRQNTATSADNLSGGEA